MMQRNKWKKLMGCGYVIKKLRPEKGMERIAHNPMTGSNMRSATSSIKPTIRIGKKSKVVNLKRGNKTQT